MSEHLTSPVRWVDIVRNMIRDGAGVFVEVGPKSILAGRMAEIAPDMAAALWMTIRISLLSVATTVALGAMLTGLRMIGGRFARWAVIGFVEFTRGTPPLGE